MESSKNWRKRYEPKEVDLGKGNKISVDVPYLERKDGVVIKTLKKLGDDESFIYQDHRFPSIDVLEFNMSRYIIANKMDFRVDLYESLNETKLVERVSHTEIIDFIKSFLVNVEEAFQEFPDFIWASHIQDEALRVVFVLSPWKAWEKFQDFFVSERVI